MKRKRAPSRYSEWTEALSFRLTAEHALFLSRGVLKEKDLSAALFTRISDYTVNSFNSAAAALAAAEGADVEFALHTFNALFARLFFFRGLPFIAQRDERALVRSLTTAASEIAERYSAEGWETDVLFEAGRLKRMIEAETK